MREPYIELGIAIVGQAIRDWRLESKACNHKLGKSAEAKKITAFLKSDLAQFICSQMDLESQVLLENLRKESAEMRSEYEKQK